MQELHDGSRRPPELVEVADVAGKLQLWERREEAYRP